MARNFAGAQRLSKGAILTANPMTYAAWVITNAAGSYGIIGIDNGGPSGGNLMYTTNAVKLYVDNGVYATPSTITFSTNTWFHAAAVFPASPTPASIYLNGGNKASTTAYNAVAGLIHTTIGSVYEGSFFDMVGQIAFPAIWNIILSDADIASLAAGIHPLHVHPEALVACPNLTGGNSPEPDLVSATPWPLVGAPVESTNPRIYAP